MRLRSRGDTIHFPLLLLFTLLAHEAGGETGDDPVQCFDVLGDRPHPGRYTLHCQEGRGAAQPGLPLATDVAIFIAMRFRQRDVAVTVADIQARRYRDMSPAEKLARADALHDLAWEAASAGVRMRHPELDENAIQRSVRELFRNAPD